MVLNETVNATVNATNGSILNSALLNQTLSKASEAASVATSFVPLVFIRLWDLIAAPFRHAEMLWIIFPLFFTLLVMELYYDRNQDEELGWGAALANSLVLVFVTIDLIKTSFSHGTPWSVLKEIVLAVFGNGQLPISPQTLILILFLAAYGIVVTVVNYFHLLPRKLAFIISHHAPINYLAYFAVAIVYSLGTDHPIPFDLATLIAAALLFIIILVIVFVIKRYIPRFLGGGNNRRW